MYCTDNALVSLIFCLEFFYLVICVLYLIHTASDSNSTDTDSSEQQTATNETADASDKSSSKAPKKKSKDKTPKENLVKVNLTAEITVLDLTPPSEGSEKTSIDK